MSEARERLELKADHGREQGLHSVTVFEDDLRALLESEAALRERVGRLEGALRTIAYDISLSVPMQGHPESHYKNGLMTAIGTAARGLEGRDDG